MRRTLFRGRPRGVSIVEALVALAVMAFGMLGIVGIQATLRFNADVAKQRSEAVRLAQQAIEDARSFVQVALPATAGVPNYASLVNQTQVVDPGHGYTTNYGAVLPVYGSNTSYTVASRLVASGDAPDSTDPRMKALQVTVSWTDRTGGAQSVVLRTTLARLAPEVAGSVALAADVGADGVPTRWGRGRNPNIPRPAVNFGDGSSGYIPPGRPAGDTTAFRFDNLSAMITLCSTAVASNELLSTSSQLVCTAGKAWPLAGVVNFASAGTAAQAVAPSGAAQVVAVALTQTFPGTGVGAPACYTTPPTTGGASSLAYLCAVPVATRSLPGLAWSGFSYVAGARITGAAGGYSVCRYTAGPPAVTSRGDLVVPAIANFQHPRAYRLVAGPLSSQNFLVVPYDEGGVADCPDGAPLPSGSTTYPQPATAP
ncbi:MAG: hypothetical protein KGL50_08905 [Burkholderiales bacterium]|nr:hypothetical protein [Burkholderiales bacterium]